MNDLHQKNEVLKPVRKILDLCLYSNVEIVSYGLAPNPNGFCFEAHEPRASDQTLAAISKELDELTNAEIEVLKGWVF